MTVRGRYRGEWVPAYAGMTVMGRYRGEWVPAYAGMTVMGRYRGEWVPAYAGMTVMGRYRGEWVPAYAGMTARVGNDGTLRAPSAVPSPAAFAVSSPLIGRGEMRRLRAARFPLRGNDGHRG